MNIKNNSLFYKMILFVIFILAIYDPWFNQNIRGVILSGGILFVLFILKSERVTTYYYKTLIYIIIFSALSLIPAIYNLTFDYTVLIMYIRMIIYSFFIYCLSREIKYKDLSVKFIVYSLILQVFVFFACVIGPDAIKEIIFSVHTASDRFYESAQEYRLFFFTSVSFFQLSLFFGFLFNLLFFLYNEKKINIIPLILCIVCGFATGRSFMIFAAISFLFNGFRFRFILLYILLLFSILFIVNNFADNRFVYHAFEPLINLINNGKFESSSSDTLKDKMLFMPTVKQILFGDGIYYNDDGTYYMRTDSGLLRQLLYGGISYLILCLLMQWYFLKNIAKNYLNKKKKIFVFSSILILSVGHVKADVFMYPSLTLMLILFLSFMEPINEN